MLNRLEILDYLRAPDTTELFARADAVRREACGDFVFVRGIVEFSSHCANNCLYCGLRRDNGQLERYRMTSAEILDAVAAVVEQGILTVVLQSGDDMGWTREALCGLIGKIKGRWPSMAITMSVGERPFDDYAAFRQAGADRYLIKHETSNPELYGRMHPGQTLTHRLRILDHLRVLGFQVGVGFIIGLPGQTLDDVAGEILFLQRFQPDMAGMGPFLPQHDTPLGEAPAGDRELTLRALALSRIATGNTHLPATTALASLDPVQGLEMGLRAGCNVIMIGATPPLYRAKYGIYDKRAKINLETVWQACRATGRVPLGDRGDSLKSKETNPAAVP